MTYGRTFEENDCGSARCCVKGHRTHDIIGPLIRDIFRAMVERVEHLFEGSDIAFSRWLTLKLIDAGRVNCIGDVDRELGIESGASTRLVDHLEAKGLVQRLRKAGDRRVVTLVITPAGRQLIALKQPLFDSFWTGQLQPFSLDEQEQLIGLLIRLRDRLAATHVASADR